MDTMKLPEWANWIVRDNDGQLLVYEEMPRRGKWAPWWDRIGKISTLDSDLYPEVTWEDEGPTYLGPALELDEQEKVVVPQFVADVFDYNKKRYWEVDESKDVPHILKCAFGNEGKPSEFLDWVRDNPEDYVMAVRNGCEVEKEVAE